MYSTFRGVAEVCTAIVLSVLSASPFFFINANFCDITLATAASSPSGAGGVEGAAGARSAPVALTTPQHDHVQRLAHYADDAEAATDVPRRVVES